MDEASTIARTMPHATSEDTLTSAWERGQNTLRPSPREVQFEFHAYNQCSRGLITSPSCPARPTTSSALAHGFPVPSRNMNPSNPVTVPLAFMQAMMTSMQAQPQLQAVGGPPSVFHGTGQAMPQQAGFPTFFLQTPQMQTLPGSFSVQQLGAGQPWVLPALQTVNAHAPQPSGFQSAAAAAATQPSVKEITASVVAAMKSTPQDMVRDKSVPVGSAPDDERILVNVLRKAQAEGLTPLQGFSTLDKVNNHTTAAWKDYFLLHVARLGPKAYPQAYTKMSASASSASSAGGSRSTSTLGGIEQRTRDESASANYSSKRGAPIEEYHEGIRIPFLSPGIQPKAPRRDPRDDSRKFTTEEKIFFIHFLKYRLRRGPVPSKEQLYKELAEQTPHHNADSWKRHWDRACELPNEIYIQARKRVRSDIQGSLQTQPSRSNASHLVESSGEEDDSGDEYEEGDTQPRDSPEYEPPVSRTPSSTAKKAKKRPPVRKYRVTEEDLRAMVEYIVDKHKCDDGWEDLTPRLRWEEFAARPENSKRSLQGWTRIASRRAKDIDAYVQEYEEEQAPPADEEILDPSIVDKSADSQSKVEGMLSTKPAGKRALENEDGPGSSEGSMSSTQKRPKLVELAGIVILD
ncbi:hypothetical protein LXA43DRAFT_66566 [Ganoderma leucocontextum]|nr:hypothetical protein LXA43DRAFT_66566 [Ganoderma leucocontextum]